MRDLTLNWDDPAFANSVVFRDVKAGTYVVVPENDPSRVRSMMDSVNGGDYVVLAKPPTTITPDSVGGVETLP